MFGIFFGALLDLMLHPPSYLLLILAAGVTMRWLWEYRREVSHGHKKSR